VIIRLRLLPNRICEGCGAHGHTDEKSLLCGACADLKIRVEDRKRKLAATVAGRFAHLKEKIRLQLKEFEPRSGNK